MSHHIPFIYNAAGAPAKAQEIVREALQRSFAGSTIGQGYAGDEDNGEMSAWYVLNSLGLYPMQVGSTDLVIGSPLFDKATVQLAGGKELVINAQDNSSENVYVQSLRVNGEECSCTSIDSRILTDGATLDFTMGSEPSAWGTGDDDGPPSLTTGDEVAKPLVDATDPSLATVTSAGGENLAALVDNTSSTQVTFATPTPPHGRLHGRQAEAHLLHDHGGRDSGCRPVGVDARGKQRRHDVDRGRLASGSRVREPFPDVPFKVATPAPSSSSGCR